MHRPVPCNEFLHRFARWTWDWLDVPALIEGAESAFENPMIDRDPVPTWVEGPVALLGDAAHAMYPTGSNGASQAIVDGRILGAALCGQGVGPEALARYDARLCGPISKLILRNRSEGPFGLLNMVDDRCGGIFQTIDDVCRVRGGLPGGRRIRTRGKPRGAPCASRYGHCTSLKRMLVHRKTAAPTSPWRPARSKYRAPLLSAAAGSAARSARHRTPSPAGFCR